MGYLQRGLWAALWLPFVVQAQSIFDVHLHYRHSDAEVLSPSAMLTMFDELHIQRAVIIGHPPRLAAELHRQAPPRIVPFLSVYRQPGDKQRWMHDPELPGWVEDRLKKGPWRGIGELHIFARDRHSPIFHRLIELAGKYEKIMMIHGDPAVIDALYRHAPRQPVIWAHAGSYPYPPLLADYLERYPALSIDLSVRNERIAPQGQLTDDWFELLLRYPDRFMLGVDTFSSQRWNNYEQVVSYTRQWLGQLPGEVANKLAYENASRLFGKH